MKLIISLALLLLTFLANSQIKNTEHTFKLSDPEIRPKATIEQITWLAGSWTGTAFDKQFEEVWNPPSAGSMVGMFKLFDQEKGVSFYELMLIVEQQGSLSLLVKHFSSEFVSWETKEDHVNFKLVAIKENELHFSGLSFYKVSDNEINAYLALRMKDDSLVEEKLVFRRRE